MFWATRSSSPIYWKKIYITTRNNRPYLSYRGSCSPWWEFSMTLTVIKPPSFIEKYANIKRKKRSHWKCIWIENYSTETLQVKTCEKTNITGRDMSLWHLNAMCNHTVTERPHSVHIWQNHLLGANCRYFFFFGNTFNSFILQ